jgi:CheY-like chemotaxis protein
MKASGA